MEQSFTLTFLYLCVSGDKFCGAGSYFYVPSHTCEPARGSLNTYQF